LLLLLLLLLVISGVREYDVRCVKLDRANKDFSACMERNVVDGLENPFFLSPGLTVDFRLARGARVVFLGSSDAGRMTFAHPGCGSFKFRVVLLRYRSVRG
jgi:hypothetical protein